MKSFNIHFTNNNDDSVKIGLFSEYAVLPMGVDTQFHHDEFPDMNDYKKFVKHLQTNPVRIAGSMVSFPGYALPPLALWKSHNLMDSEGSLKTLSILLVSKFSDAPASYIELDPFRQPEQMQDTLRMIGKKNPDTGKYDVAEYLLDFMTTMQFKLLPKAIVGFTFWIKQPQ